MPTSVRAPSLNQSLDCRVLWLVLRAPNEAANPQSLTTLHPSSSLPPLHPSSSLLRHGRDQQGSQGHPRDGPKTVRYLRRRF